MPLIQRLTRFIPRSAILVAALSFCLGSCAVTSEPLTPDERAVRVEEDMLAIFGGAYEHEPVLQPIGLYEAMARTLKYNLDARVKLLETALAEKAVDLTAMSMLPRIVANAGYTVRNNDSASVSKTLFGGVQSLEPSTSSDKTNSTGGLQMAWNILDFGVSYFQTKQDANRVLIARERRRKVLQNLLQDVRAAYWRALAAQKLLPELEKLIDEAEFALDSMSEVEQKGLQAPAQTLDYQMTLMETLRDIKNLRQEMQQARTELASLMNLKPGSYYRLVDPGGKSFSVPDIRGSLDRVEWLALMNRPELREEDYRLKIDQLETRKSILRLLPGIEMTQDFSYDSNPFLYNSTWGQAALRVGFNLLNPGIIEKQRRLAKTQEQLDIVRRQALTMAVLTQVHVSWGRYRSARDRFELNVSLSGVADRMVEQAENAAKLQALPEAERIRTVARATYLRLQKELSYAELQDAAGSVYVTVGMDPTPDEVTQTSLPVLANAIQRAMQGWTLGSFLGPDKQVIAPPVPKRRPVVTVKQPVPDQMLIETEPFIFTIDPAIFAEADLGDGVRYTASQLNGDPLPSWVYFDYETLEFSGRPPSTSVGVHPIRLRARNMKGSAAQSAFVMTVRRKFLTSTTLSGTKNHRKVSIIRRCQGEKECNRPNRSHSAGDRAPGKVIVEPVTHRQW